MHIRLLSAFVKVFHHVGIRCGHILGANFRRIVMRVADHGVFLPRHDLSDSKENPHRFAGQYPRLDILEGTRLQNSIVGQCHHCPVLKDKTPFKQLEDLVFKGLLTKLHGMDTPEKGACLTPQQFHAGLKKLLLILKMMRLEKKPLMPINRFNASFHLDW